jgi:hypothetical protein
VGAGLLAAGCGGSSGNGVASRSPAAILRAAKSAASKASAVHVQGSVREGSQTININMDAGSHGGKGTITLRGATADIRVVSSTAYLKGDRHFYEIVAHGSSGVASLLAGKWLKVPANDPSFRSFSSLSNVQQVMGSALKAHGHLRKAGTKTVNGQSVVGIRESGANGGTLYVSTTGKPYPVEFTKSNKGTIVFSQWNESVKVTAPKGAVSLGSLGG